MNIPDTMKAAVLYNYNDLRVVKCKVPRPGPFDVLIKVKACAICGTDPKIVANGWPDCPPFGEFILGHEFTGEIVETGPKVTSYKIGDRVAVESHKGCGHCINCIRGYYTTCLNYGNIKEGHRHYGFTVNGGYAEYVVCHINCIHRFSDNLSFKDATLITTAGTSLYGIQRSGWIWPGDTVVIIGPGPVGLMAIQIAKVCGAGKIIAIGTRESRLYVAKEVGADICINIKKDDNPQRIISELTNKNMADMIIETSGSVSGAQQAIDLVKKNGRITFLGIYKEDIPLNLNKIVQSNIQIAGGKAEGEYSLERLIPLMEKGKIISKPIITHEFTLEDINKGMETYIKRKDGAIKVIIMP